MEFNKAISDLHSAKTEMTRLLKESEAFQLQKDTASVRIANLEKSLTDARDEARRNETKLKAQLAKELLNKEKQSRELEEALDEIQRLKQELNSGGKQADGKFLMACFDSFELFNTLRQTHTNNFALRG